jgi:hypothetical protein
MASEMPTAPDGFVDASAPTSDGSDAIELSPGETLFGPVLDIAEGESEYGPWFRLTIKDRDLGRESEDTAVVDYFAKDEVKTALKQGNLERGDTVWIARGTEEQELDDGGSYLPTFCKIQGDF